MIYRLEELTPKINDLYDAIREDDAGRLLSLFTELVDGYQISQTAQDLNGGRSKEDKQRVKDGASGHQTLSQQHNQTLDPLQGPSILKTSN